MKYLVGLVLLVILASCNSVHKMSSSVSVKSDSVSIVHRDSAGVKKLDSNVLKVDSGSYERETVYVYDTVTVAGDPVVKYVPRIVKVIEKGKYNKSEATSLLSYDSGFKKQADTGSVSKSYAEVTKEKTSHRFPITTVLLGVLLVGVAGAAYYVFRKRA